MVAVIAQVEGVQQPLPCPSDLSRLYIHPLYLLLGAAATTPNVFTGSPTNFYSTSETVNI